MNNKIVKHFVFKLIEVIYKNEKIIQSHKKAYSIHQQLYILQKVLVHFIFQKYKQSLEKSCYINYMMNLKTQNL